MHSHTISGRHLRAGDEEVFDSVGQRGDRGGTGECCTVAAAPHHGDDEGVLRQVDVGARRSVCGEEAGEVGHVHELRRDLAGGDRVVHGAVAVDPQLVVEVSDAVDAHVFPLAHRGHRVVEHLAQAQHDACIGLLRPELGERLVEFAVRTERVAVDDDQVRSEGQKSARDDRGAQSPDPLRRDIEPAGNVGGEGTVPAVLPLRSLRDAGDQEPVPAVGQGELGGIARAGDDEAGHRTASRLGHASGQGLGDRKVAPRVAQAHGVMRVEHHSQCIRVWGVAHRFSWGSAGRR